MRAIGSQNLTSFSFRSAISISKKYLWRLFWSIVQLVSFFLCHVSKHFFKARDPSKMLLNLIDITKNLHHQESILCCSWKIGRNGHFRWLTHFFRSEKPSVDFHSEELEFQISEAQILVIIDFNGLFHSRCFSEGFYQVMLLI